MRTWALPALAAAVALWVALSQHHLLGDDAYITFRYARNLAEGNGLVYNPGEPVLGTSTPLFTLLLAAGHRLGLGLPDLAVWMSGFSWAVAILALGYVLRHRPAWAGVPLLVLAASATFAENLGMESALYALLCLASLLLAGSGRGLPAAALAGLAALTRLDGGIVVVVVLVATALRERRLPWKEAALAGLIVAPWYLWAWGHYGSPFPNSLHAKAGLAHSPGFGGGDFVQGGLALLRGRLARWPLLVPYLGLALMGLPRALRSAAPWQPYVAWGGLYTVAYWLTGMPHFGWYYVPLVPLVAVLAVEGLHTVATVAGRWRGLAVTLLAAALLLPAGQMLTHSLRSAEASPARALAYRDAGQWLSAHAQPGDSVALLEIGVVGWFSGIEVVDTMGLVSPYLAERLLDWGQSLVLAVNRFWPEYVLAVDATAWEAVEREPWFQRAYQVAASFDYSAQGDPAARMRLYRRLPAYPPRPNTSWTPAASPRPEVQLSEVGLPGVPVLNPGATVPLVMTWQCLAPLVDDLTISVAVRPADGTEIVVAPEQGPLRGGLPTRLWRPGETITEVIPLALPPEVPAGPARLVVSLGEATWVAGEVLVSPTPAQLAALLEHREPITFGEGDLAAVGWTIHTQDARPGEAIDVTVGWQVPDALIDGLSAFLHLADAQERPLAQWDGAPYEGQGRALDAGEALASTYTLALPEDVAPGQYQLLLGVYEWDTGERLRPQSARGLPSGAVVVGTITVSGE